MGAGCGANHRGPLQAMTPPDSDPGWWVFSEGWSADNVTHHGNLFLLGNGRMGCRGTLEEFGPDEKAGILIPGLYDRAGDAWREPVNAPNGFFTRVAVNGTWLNPLHIEPASHRQSLDMHHAVHHRQTRFCVGGTEVIIKSERFLSAAEPDLMALRYAVQVRGEAEITLESGIDSEIWDINGPHLEHFGTGERDGAILLKARTKELGHELAVAECCAMISSAPMQSSRLRGTLRQWRFLVKGEADITLEKCVAISSSLDASGGSAEETAWATALSSAGAGYANLRAAHEGVWEDRWQKADVRIEGDDEARHALRYSLYQLLSAAPFHSEYLSIPARALSGQVYKGAIFWDTEIFMFPFFLAVFPEVARNLVRYRIHTLTGARAKAAGYGFEGAYYPWEGQEGGFDACTLFNITDVFTNRPMRTYFRDKQIHISGDVAWAVWKYVQATDDTELLWDGGWEVMLECARFFFSYAFKKTTSDEFVLVDVTGPDEYHERVANNAYTNHLVQFVVAAAMEAAGLLRAADPQRFAAMEKHLGFSPGEEARLVEFANNLFCPQPDQDTLLIAQFDGYSQLEDCPLSELKARVLDPAEYLGGGCGLATTTQILKQADVVLLLHLLGDRFDRTVKQANWDYYEPRTEHGSSLSACVYALVAAELGYEDFARRYFLKTATVDLTGHSKQYVGTLYIGGTHPAANGGAWMVATRGFGGVQFLPDGLAIDPRLPSGWTAMDFRVVCRGYALALHIEHGSCQVRIDRASAKAPARLVINGTAHNLATCPDTLIFSNQSQTNINP